jgi:transposase
MQAYSMDLRERVLADCEQGMKPSAVGDKYSVSTRFVQKLLKRHRETGDIRPRTGKPGPKAKWLQHVAELQAMVQAQPDATLEEYSLLFKKQLGLDICYVSVWRVFKKLGITLKKSTSCC